jgi:hypothetical protein
MRVRNPLYAPRRDPDPSRIDFGHGIGDFVRRAGRDHEELPDNVAEPPVAGRGGLLARSFRCSRSDLDRTACKQELESGSERTGTSCKTLHRHTRQYMSNAPNSRSLRSSVLALFSPPRRLFVRPPLGISSGETLAPDMRTIPPIRQVLIACRAGSAATIPP